MASFGAGGAKTTMPLADHGGQPLGSSFRDPSGYVFEYQGVLYREVKNVYRDHYDALTGGGLYDSLVGAGLLVPHDEVSLSIERGPDTYKIIRPERIPFVSYPYEWSFSQLKGAALATLDILRRSLSFDMILKDASAYNIQFRGHSPALIDTLSFETYEPGEPWGAYRQFCQHFLAPLALMAYRDVRLSALLRTYLEGVPLDLASSLLPKRTWLRFSLAIHLHLHSRMQRRYSGLGVTAGQSRRGGMSKRALLGLAESLSGVIRSLRWKPTGTEWADYARSDSYEPDAIEHKLATVTDFIGRVRPASVWDLGANVGVYSRAAAAMGVPVVAFDIDPAAVEQHYLACVARDEKRVLPLVLDLTNPSPAMGWAHRERDALRDRGPAGMVLALALCTTWPFRTTCRCIGSPRPWRSSRPGSWSNSCQSRTRRFSNCLRPARTFLPITRNKDSKKRLAHITRS